MPRAHQVSNSRARRVYVCVCVFVCVCVCVCGYVWLCVAMCDSYDLAWGPDVHRLECDITAALAEPIAFQCLLRMRCSMGFHVGAHMPRACDDPALSAVGGAAATTDTDTDSWFGRGFGDVAVANLWHLAICRPNQSLGCVFEFETNAGFAGYDCNGTAIVQLCFEYTTLESRTVRVLDDSHPRDEGSGSGSDSDSVDTDASGELVVVWSVVRKLRVLSVRSRIARSPYALYEPVCERSVVSLILQQVLHRVSDAASIAQARVLLRDWLTTLVMNHHRVSNTAYVLLFTAMQGLWRSV